MPQLTAMEVTARGIVSRLQDAGYVAWFAGGCVRDQLRGVQAYDFDIATSAHPEEVQKLFPRNVAVGAHFGVIVVLIGDQSFEVATFRSDDAYLDGRRPTGVRFTTPREDAERRDFTINAMFYDPVKELLVDYVDGQVDLEKKLIRAVGPAGKRFAEDKLRMLRAIRFATTLECEIDSPTWEAVLEHAPEINQVSAERIRDELLKTFRSPHRVRGLDLLDQSGLLAAVLPEVAALHGCEQPPQFHPEGDVFVHTRLMLDMLAPEVPDSLFLSVLFHDIGKPRTFSFDPAEGRIRFSGHDTLGAKMTFELMQRLRFPNEEIDRVVSAVANHMVFKDVPRMRISKLKRFMARPDFDREIELHRVDCGSSHGDLSNIDYLRQKADEFANEPLIPPPLITGRDLIALGLEPGPQFKTILENIETAQLENRITTREQALATLATGITSPPGQEETEAQRRDRTAWWQDARFGLFIHWDMSSLAGSEISWSRQGSKPLDITGDPAGFVADPAYDNLYQTFNPTKFDARAWVRLAKSAGAKYLVFTAKHHDGFCMWDTKLTDYSIMHTPFRRDVLRELADACHEAGLRFGIYYSPRDWYQADYGVGDNRKYVAYLDGQLRELLTDYGQVDVLWLDSYGVGDPVNFWRIPETWSLIKSLQPAILINDRLAAIAVGGGPNTAWTNPPESVGDFDTPEQRLGVYRDDRLWESCMTLVDAPGGGWSYRTDGIVKPTEEGIRMLVNCASGDGNLLLDAGPDATGVIPADQAARLVEMGQWLDDNGESIYGTRGGPFEPGEFGGSTRKAGSVYLHVLQWPDGTLRLPPLPLEILSSRVLGGGRVEVKQSDAGLEIDVPAEDRRAPDTIVALEVAGDALKIPSIRVASPGGS